MMKPVLIYKSSDTCFDVLNFMAQQLGDALMELGVEVLYYDAEAEGARGLMNHLGKEYAAVIGFQAVSFSVFLHSAGKYLNDMIIGPKFNFFFDHPFFLGADCCEKCPGDYYVLTHDTNYIEFIKRYYPNIKDAYLLPPGGETCKNLDVTTKTIDLAFVGSYVDYRSYFSRIKTIKKSHRKLANKYISRLRHEPEKAQEEVLRNLLQDEKIVVSNEGFLEIFDEFKLIILCLNAYYREKVVRTLAESKINIVVYGDSWKESPIADNKSVSILPGVSPMESLEVFAKTRLSLNVMSGHKAGFTERIANSMLNRSVVISDKTICLTEQYLNGEEIILYSLDKIDELPKTVKELLDNPERIDAIADRAYTRAVNEDTWRHRAELFLEYLQEIRG